MALSEFEIKRVEKVVGAFIKRRRPPLEIRNQVDLSCRISGQSVEIFEIRPLWNNPDKKVEESIAKATYVKSRKVWRIFWQRTDLKWHRYEPDPEVDSIEAFLTLVEEDDYAAFWG